MTKHKQNWSIWTLNSQSLNFIASWDCLAHMSAHLKGSLFSVIPATWPQYKQETEISSPYIHRMFLEMHLHLQPKFVSSPKVSQAGLISWKFSLLLPFGVISVFPWRDLSLSFPIGQLNLEEFNPIIFQSLFEFPLISHNESHSCTYEF